MAHGHLHVADRDAGYQPGGAEGAAQAVRADPVVDTRAGAEPAQSPGGASSVQAMSEGVEQDRAVLAAVGGFPDGPEHGDWQRDVRRFGAFAEDVEDLVAGLVADVVDVGMTRLGNAKP